MDENGKDLVDYANRYGDNALGFAICELIASGEFKPSNELANLIWEFGGRTE